jgi:hypothetical protein
MNMNNAIMTTMGVIAVLAIISVNGLNNAFAEEETSYKTAENVHAIFTFQFRDGLETHQFPVYRMTSDFITNGGTTFEVEGIIGNSPYLHKALDEAFKYRMMTSSGSSSFEYDYRFFDVDVDLTRDGQTMRTLHYYNCEILDYEATTLKSNDYESYHSSKSGFALVDKIEFRCGGLNGESSSDSAFPNLDYGSMYDFSENVRTFITFEFDGGVEKIEFPVFELNSAFEESDDSVTPSFSVEGVVDYYPLLYKAIDNARKVSGGSYGFNTDFEALVEFSNGEKTLRSLDFRDCRVSGAIINTEYDKEEGYTGKSGFALVNEIDFDCAGLKPINGSYEQFHNSGAIREPNMVNQQPNNDLQMADNVRIMTTFTFNKGVAELEFPIFKQGNVLSKSNPTFELEGIVGDYPLLYKRVDENLKLQSVSGANLMTELFDIDVNIVNGEIIRGFNYSSCRVIDYGVGSAMNKEENYFKAQFSLENTFEFECQGYHPNNPLYDKMFKSNIESSAISSNDLRNTDDWGPGFYVE